MSTNKNITTSVKIIKTVSLKYVSHIKLFLKVFSYSNNAY